MTSELFDGEPEHATPLDPDDQLGLIPGWIATRADLNLAEATNISQAMVRLLPANKSAGQILEERFVRSLHKDMFGNGWTWAGKYRRHETSIGVAPEQISVDVVNLLEDAKYWIATTDVDALDVEICRVHHRLVSIHPFPNGNGRMSRLFADLLLRSLRRPLFSWGGFSLDANSEVRRSYIQALRAADAGDLVPLSEFVRAK